MCNLTTNFKTKLIKWLTGNYNTETTNDDLSFYEIEAVNTGNFYNKILDKLHELYGTGGAFDYKDAFRILQGSNNANNGESFTVVFGGYDGHGYIMLLDENSNIEYVITGYSSGTQFKPIKAMGTAEDGTFFMVEETSGNPRFVMLNNILAKLPGENYQAVLRKSYAFPSNYLQDFYPIIKKAPGTSRYFMTTFQYNYGETNMALEINVNVGEQNEWNVYTLSLPSGTLFFTYDTFPSWDNQGNLTFKIGGLAEHQDSTIYYNEMSGNYNNAAITRTEMFQLGVSSVYGLQRKFDMRFENLNTTYIAAVETEVSSDKATIGYIDYDNNNYNILETSYPQTATVNEIWFYPIKDELMLSYVYKGDNNNNFVNFGRIYNNNVYMEEIYETSSGAGFLPYFSVSKKFNLYEYKMQLINILVRAKEIYNSSNYNGIDYQNYNSMIPNSEISYDSNNKIVFARNLYDKLVQGNTTTSIVQIPYDYANGIQIDNNYLYGETNTNLLQDDTSFTKNIYEEVMINFINRITMNNKNDVNNVITNNIGASRLNQSTSQTLDYNNAKLTKCRINYTDDTTKIIPISNTLVGLVATYNFVVYVDKEINTIDLISNDGNTTYCSIDGSNFDTNKYYAISQEVEIN